MRINDYAYLNVDDRDTTLTIVVDRHPVLGRGPRWIRTLFYPKIITCQWPTKRTTGPGG